MRLKFAKKAGGLAMAGLLFGVLFAKGAAAQNPDTLMPEASAAKAKQILSDLINALGGAAYLEIKESDCEGRLARFGHAGELTGFTNFKTLSNGRVYWVNNNLPSA